VVEVPVGEDQVGDAGQPGRPAARLEGEARRVDPEPGFGAGAGRAADPELAELEDVGRDQISR
jgi:hypothetical protein